MINYDLNETIRHGLESNTAWRSETAKKFPDDQRNSQAAATSEKLANDVQVSEDLAARYNAVMSKIEALVGTDQEIAQEQISEIESGAFSAIGFNTSPETADEVGESLVSSLEDLVSKGA